MSELVETAHVVKALSTLPRRCDRYVADCLEGLGWDEASGRGVRVNGRRVEDGGALVFPATDRVEVGACGLPSAAPPRRRARVVAYHKPKKMATDVGAEFGAKMRRAVEGFGCGPLMPVGQLDVMTTGLLLFTDDGELARLICAPGRLKKVYRCGFDGPRGAGEFLTPAQVAALTEARPLGVNRAERNAARRSRDAARPLQVRFDDVAQVGGGEPFGDDTLPPGCAPKARYEVDVTLTSGANHVIKRLFMQRCNKAVRTLKRVAVGPVALDGVPREGDHRELAKEEVDALWAALGGLGALLDFKRAHLVCRRRSARDPRLAAFLGKDDPTVRCFHKFPGLHCAHDDDDRARVCGPSDDAKDDDDDDDGRSASPTPSDASSDADGEEKRAMSRSLSKTQSGFLKTAAQVFAEADEEEPSMSRSLSKTSSGFLKTAAQVFAEADEDRSMSRSLSKTSSGFLKTAGDLAAEEKDDRSMSRSLSKTASGLLKTVNDLEREDKDDRPMARSLSKTQSGFLKTADEVEREAKKKPRPAALEVSGKCPVCVEDWDSAENERGALPCCGKTVCGDCVSFLSMMARGAKCPICRTPKA